jgi:hypothetical protein
MKTSYASKTSEEGRKKEEGGLSVYRLRRRSTASETLQ